MFEKLIPFSKWESFMEVVKAPMKDIFMKNTEIA